MGKMFYCLALRPLTGPMRIPKFLYDFWGFCKVTKSPSAVLTWVHTNTWNHPPPKRGPTHLNLFTNMPSWYLQENISSKAHKHIHLGNHNQQDSKIPNQETRVPSPSSPCMLTALLCNPGCLHQAPCIITALLCDPECLLQALSVH